MSQYEADFEANLFAGICPDCEGTGVIRVCEGLHPDECEAPPGRWNDFSCEDFCGCEYGRALNENDLADYLHPDGPRSY